LIILFNKQTKHKNIIDQPMELFYRFSVVVAIVSTLALSSCTDDVYDPERGIQTKPKENPLGEDFTAPMVLTGPWSTP
jgi:hypothetical protein